MLRGREVLPAVALAPDLRTVLRSALSTAEREELIATNVAKLVSVPSGGPASRRRGPVTRLGPSWSRPAWTATRCTRSTS
jgi:hypothetical protein